MRTTYRLFPAASIILAAILVLGACAGPGEETTGIETFDQAKQIAAEQGSVILLDFYTDW